MGLGGFSTPTYSNGNFFFHSGYPYLSLTTQTRFSNLTILNTLKQRTDKLCLVAVANEFAALNDNWKDNFGTFTESCGLKNVRVTLNRCVLGLVSKSIHLNFGLKRGPGCNECDNYKFILLFRLITIGSFRCIYSHFRRLKFEIFSDSPSLLTLTRSH